MEDLSPSPPSPLRVGGGPNFRSRRKAARSTSRLNETRERRATYGGASTIGGRSGRLKRPGGDFSQSAATVPTNSILPILGVSHGGLKEYIVANLMTAPDDQAGVRRLDRRRERLSTEEL